MCWRALARELQRFAVVDGRDARISRYALEDETYEWPEERVSSASLEARLAPVYERLHLGAGQLRAEWNCARLEGVIGASYARLLRAVRELLPRMTVHVSAARCE